MWKYMLAWVPMVIIAIGNGFLREKIIAKYVKELQAHQLSTVTLILFFGIYIWIILTLWKPISAQQAIRIGMYWLVLTIAFEFLFGFYVAGHSWSRLLQDYNLFAGRVWSLVLIWVTIAPYLMYRLQQF